MLYTLTWRIYFNYIVLLGNITSLCTIIRNWLYLLLYVISEKHLGWLKSRDNLKPTLQNIGQANYYSSIGNSLGTTWKTSIWNTAYYKWVVVRASKFPPRNSPPNKWNSWSGYFNKYETMTKLFAEGKLKCYFETLPLSSTVVTALPCALNCVETGYYRSHKLGKVTTGL